MYEPQQPPAWDQLGLFEGGYEQIVIEFTVHLNGNSDVFQVGAVIKDLFTYEWIGAQVPVALLDIEYPDECGAWFAQLLEGAHRNLNPF